MKNRYLFFKRLFPEYVIIFKKKNNYSSMNWDKRLISFISRQDLNYIIIDNNNNIEIYSYNENKYKEYIIRLFLKDLVYFLLK